MREQPPTNSPLMEDGFYHVCLARLDRLIYIYIYFFFLDPSGAEVFPSALKVCMSLCVFFFLIPL